MARGIGLVGCGLLLVVVEPPAGLPAQEPRRHHPLQQGRGGVDRVLELVVQHAGDVQRGVQPDEVEQGQRAHRVGQPQVHGLVDVLFGGDAVVEHLDRAVQVRHQQEVHDEPGPVLGQHGLLADPLAVGPGELDRLVGGLQPPDDLHQLQHRRRVEEVHADHPVGPAGLGGQLRDGKRRRVGGQHDLVAGELRELGEDILLDVDVLGGGLDHQVHVGNRADVGPAGDPPEDPVAVLLGELPLLDGPPGRLLDRASGPLDLAVLDLDEHDVLPGPGDDLDDPRAHDPRADDPDPLDLVSLHAVASLAWAPARRRVRARVVVARGMRQSRPAAAAPSAILSRRMPTVISRDGTELFVEVLGDGEPVVLLAHGLTGNRNELAIFAPFLPGTKVLMDFRGHGNSGRPPTGSYTFDHLAGDVDAVAEAYGASVVAGGSMGAAATLRLLEADPARFDKLIIVLPARLEVGDETYVRLSRMADLLEEHGPEKTADIMLEEEEAAGAFDQFPASKEYRRAAILATNSDGVPRAIRGVINDVALRDPERIRQVTAPTLIIAQEGDSFHSTEVARELEAAMPNSELVVLPDQHALLREIPTLITKVHQLLSA